MTLHTPSGCFTMSTFGPLQKFSRTFVASGALSRISTRPVPSTRGYCASQTLVEAGWKSHASCAEQGAARHGSSASASPSRIIVAPREVALFFAHPDEQTPAGADTV